MYYGVRTYEKALLRDILLFYTIYNTYLHQECEFFSRWFYGFNGIHLIKLVKRFKHDK